MPVYLQCLLMAVIIPVIISAYAMIRRPVWSGDTTTPWWRINLLSALGGIMSAVLSSVIMLERGVTDIWTLLYITEVMAVLGWMSVSCSITDFQARKIDRHMLRPIYTIQAIIAIPYMRYTIHANNVFWIMLAMMLALMAIMIVVGYIRKLGYGASDARCHAAMFALCTPALRTMILYPFAFSIIALVITGLVVFTVERNKAKDAVVSYDADGKPNVRERDVKRMSRIEGDRIHTPAGHAITIPFLVMMFIWISMA